MIAVIVTVSAMHVWLAGDASLWQMTGPCAPILVCTLLLVLWRLAYPHLLDLTRLGQMCSFSAVQCCKRVPTCPLVA